MPHGLDNKPNNYMGRTRIFYFEPLKVHKGRVKNDFKPFVRIAKSGQVHVGKQTLEHMGWNKKMFYRLYQDVSKRAIALHFTEKENLPGESSQEWKVWDPKSYKKGEIKFSFGVGSFVNGLSDVLLPSKRLPIDVYKDTDLQLDFYWFAIPRGDADPEGRKFEI